MLFYVLFKIKKDGRSIGSSGKPQSAIQPNETNYRNVDKEYIFPNTLNLDQVIAPIYTILMFMFT